MNNVACMLAGAVIFAIGIFVGYQIFVNQYNIIN